MFMTFVFFNIFGRFSLEVFNCLFVLLPFTCSYHCYLVLQILICLMVIFDGTCATIKWYYCFAEKLVDMILDYKCSVYNNQALCYFMTHLANKFCGLIWRELETHRYLIVILFKKQEVCAASLFIYKGCILSEICESFIKMIFVLSSFFDFSMVMFFYVVLSQLLKKQGLGSARISSDMFCGLIWREL